MKIDYKKLLAGLETLSGKDFAAAERELRLIGDTTPEVIYSKTFSAILVGKILSMPVDDVQALPIKEYATATALVSNFLLEDLAALTL